MLNAELERLISHCPSWRDARIVRNWAKELFEKLRDTPEQDRIFAQDYNWYNIMAVVEYISQNPPFYAKGYVQVRFLAFNFLSSRCSIVC